MSTISADIMEITNPKRILLLGPPEAGHLELLKELTGNQPTPAPSGSLSGLSHTLSISTPYYKASIPIWVDEIPLDNPEIWIDDFSQPEAAEVLDAVEACIVIFRKPVNDTDAKAIKSLLKGISKVIRDNGGEPTFLAVGMKQSILPHLTTSKSDHEDWDNDIMDIGFEWIDAEADGKNEYGECRGVKRIIEALETCDWNFDDDTIGGMDTEEFLETAALDIDNFMRDLENDRTMMKRLILEDDPKDVRNEEEDQVEGLETMISKVHAIRERGADLPIAERKKYASKEVAKLMNTL